MDRQSARSTTGSPWRWQRLGALLLAVIVLMAACTPAKRVGGVPAATVLADPESFIGQPQGQEAPAERAAAPVLNVPPAPPTPTRQRPETLTRTYQVRPNDTLTGIAAATGMSVELLMRINGLSDADALAVGQTLKLSLEAEHQGPTTLLIPDSELVYGPALADFDVAQATAAFPGPFAHTVESFEFSSCTAAELVELTALRYSVGPRVLLTLMEMESGWLSNPQPSEAALLYPLGYEVQGWDGLGRQLAWAADLLNAGFYGWLEERTWTYPLGDGSYVEIALNVNAGTAAVQRFLALGAADYGTFLQRLDTFSATYRRLWGDPFAYAVEPLLPATLQAPTLVLPWPEQETWYLTGGPHGGWDSGSSWAALDFVTGEQYLGCMMSQQWVTAAAAGPIIFSDQGMVFQDLDADGFIGTGWTLLYMHMGSEGRAPVGAELAVGDPIGHPSCEGGYSDASHLHFARRYNGVWIAAAHPRWPLVLSGWTASGGATEYDGALTREGVVKVAAETWADVNAVTH